MGQIKSLSQKSSSGAPRQRATNPTNGRKRSKKEKPMKAIFKGLTMSICGNHFKFDKSLTYESIAQYITLHGGTYEREVTDDTTHLICSIEEYKKKGVQVQKAWRLGKNKCHIVVFDWLEDCLISTVKTKKLLKAKPYTLDRTIARINKGKTDHEKYRRQFEEGVQASKELCDNKLHHVFQDQHGFEYKVVLTRVNILQPNKPEKYTLYLFESHAIPHTYMCGAKFTRRGIPTNFWREECHPMHFAEAFRNFKKFFHARTGIDWDDRLEGIRLEDPMYFRYIPPILGRPCGATPWGYVRPELRLQEDAEKEVDVVYDTDSEVGDSDDEGTANSEATSATLKGSDSSLESSGFGDESASPRDIHRKTPSWHSDEE